MSQKIFISYGHNELVALKVRDFIVNRLKKEPVILSEQPKEGLTIIEALEKYAEGCEFAVIILTEDDVTVDGELRGRQNVIHELGYFQGKLGRKKVILLKQKNVTLPSNISGLFYIEFDKDIQTVFEDLRKVLEKQDASFNTKQLKNDCIKELTKFVKEVSSVDNSWKKEIADEIKPFVGLPPKQFFIMIRPILEKHGSGYKKQALEIKHDIENKRKKKRSSKKDSFSAMLDFASVLIIGPSERIAQLCESAIRLIDSVKDEDDEISLNKTKRIIEKMFDL